MENDVTQLLRRVSEGSDRARDDLWRMLYDELHALADGCFRNLPNGHTLQPTALVSEAFLRLNGDGILSPRDRDHFFRTAARAMRHILIDHARRSRAAKRGADRERVPLDPNLPAATRDPTQLLALHEALQRLEQLDESLARLVDLHVFAGLSLEECAALQDVSRRTAYRMWKMAIGWLYREMNRDG